MERYGKTYNLFDRDPTTHKLLPNRYSRDEFDYLKDCRWHFTEKLDGTNMRLIFHPYREELVRRRDCLAEGNIYTDIQLPRFELRGRSDAASVHGNLQDWVEQWKYFSLPLATELFNSPVCIYGEGIGAGIQKGGDHYGETHFRVFAIKINNFWLAPENVTDICHTLHLQQASHVLTGTLEDGVARVRAGLRTMIGPQSGCHFAEGLVGVPDVPIKDRFGDRIIVKIKHKDLYHA